MFDKLWELREVGVHFIIIAHTKSKEISDRRSGDVYQILTANASQKYFNAIKTKLHVLGVAYIDRTIVKEKTGKKDFKGKEVEKNKVTSESRVIKFRDDNYSVDSKSRFADIIDEIPMDSDEFIKAIQDAISAESKKSGKSQKEIEDYQKARDAEAGKAAEEYSKSKSLKENEAELVAEALATIKDNFSTIDTKTKTAYKKVMSDYGFSKFSDENIPLEALEKIVELINKFLNDGE